MKKTLASLLVMSTVFFGTSVPNIETAQAATMDYSYQAKIVEAAKSYIGKVQYTNAYDPATGKLDCSGYTYEVFKKAGINLGSIDDDVQGRVGEKIARSALQPGDLVFFWNGNSVDENDVGHVGIYIGNGQYIHNANATYDVMISSMNTSYVDEHFITARRVLPQAMPTVSNPATPQNIVDIAYYLKDKAKYGWTYSPSTLTFNSPAFVTYVYKQAGIDFGLTASQAIDLNQVYKKGTSVAVDDLQIGDLVFHGSSDKTTLRSVGIYLGEGIFMSDNGGVTRNVIFSDMTIDYYKDRFIGAKRLLKTTDTTPAPIPAVTGAQVVTAAKALDPKVQFATNTYNESTLQFDAPGFVYYSYKQAGKTLSTRSITEMAKLGTAVDKTALQPGDMVFLWTTTAGVPGHVGIYVGDGKYIHNADSTYDVLISPITSGSYADSHFLTARRVLAN